MKDPKTTILGIVSLVIAALTYAYQFLSTHAWPPSLATIGLFLLGVMGVLAKDSQSPPTP